VNELTVTENRLPDDIQDLSRFVLVGREKLVSVKAEIKAIEKLNLAREVRDQKRDEARMLSELLLDAEVKLGELFKNIPASSHDRGNQYTGGKTTAVSLCQKSAGTDAENKTKTEIVEELGFTKRHSERLESLAENKDIVEQVKAEARKNDEFPTRTQVFNFAEMRKQMEGKRDMRYVQGGDTWKTIEKVISLVRKLEISRDDAAALIFWHEDSGYEVREHIKDISQTLTKLNGIKNMILAEEMKKHDKKRAQR
jgi:D-ribose pyranose/furanose isomerase RbsD